MRIIIWILLSPLLFFAAIIYGLIALLFAAAEWIIDVDGKPTV